MDIFPSFTTCLEVASQAIVMIPLGIFLAVMAVFGYTLQFICVAAVYPFVLTYNLWSLLLPYWWAMGFAVTGGILFYIIAIITLVAMTR